MQEIDGLCRSICYKGKTIIYLDFSNLKHLSQINEVIQEATASIHKNPLGSVLTLTNINDMHFDTDITEAFKRFIAGNKPYVKAGAVVGVNGLKKIVYNAVMKFTGRDIVALDDLEMAKDYLAQK